MVTGAAVGFGFEPAAVIFLAIAAWVILAGFFEADYVVCAAENFAITNTRSNPINKAK